MISVDQFRRLRPILDKKLLERVYWNEEVFEINVDETKRHVVQKDSRGQMGMKSFIQCLGVAKISTVFFSRHGVKSPYDTNDWYMEIVRKMEADGDKPSFQFDIGFATYEDPAAFGLEHADRIHGVNGLVEVNQRDTHSVFLDINGNFMQTYMKNTALMRMAVEEIRRPNFAPSSESSDMEPPVSSSVDKSCQPPLFDYGYVVQKYKVYSRMVHMLKKHNVRRRSYVLSTSTNKTGKTLMSSLTEFYNHLVKDQEKALQYCKGARCEITLDVENSMTIAVIPAICGHFIKNVLRPVFRGSIEWEFTDYLLNVKRWWALMELASVCERRLNDVMLRKDRLLINGFSNACGMWNASFYNDLLNLRILLNPTLVVGALATNCNLEELVSGLPNVDNLKVRDNILIKLYFYID